MQNVTNFHLIKKRRHEVLILGRIKKHVLELVIGSRSLDFLILHKTLFFTNNRFKLLLIIDYMLLPKYFDALLKANTQNKGHWQ